MRPKPGNAFAQQKEIEEQICQRTQRHTRDFSHATSSSASTVRVNPENNPLEESLGSSAAQDMPDTPKTTMAMFTEASFPEESQDTQPHLSPHSRKKARKEKKKHGAKQSLPAPQHPRHARSSAMPEPLFAERQGGLDFLRSTFSRGRRALTRTTPVSTLQSGHVLAPFDFEHREDILEQPAEPDLHSTITELQNADPAVLRARTTTAPSQTGPALSHILSETIYRSKPVSEHVPASTSDEPALTSTQTPVGMSQEPALANVHSPANVPQHSNVTTSYALASASQPALQVNMQVPLSAIPDRYRTSTSYREHDSNLALHRPYAGLMPYSHYLPQRRPQDGHLSTSTQQTYATAQSKYASMNDNKGIIFGGKSISPTRRGTYAIAGNVEVVSRPSVTSMTGIVEQVSPISQGPEHRMSSYQRPHLAATRHLPRLDAPLPCLPASVWEGRARDRPLNTEDAQHSGNNNAPIGTWEQMKAQHSDSMPQLSPLPHQHNILSMYSDPPYLATRDGLVPATSLYNFHASGDTKSEGQKSQLEAAEATDDSDGGEESEHATNNVKNLLRKSGFRRAFSDVNVKLSYRMSSVNAEAAASISSSSSSGKIQIAVSPCQPDPDTEVASASEAGDTTVVRHAAPATQSMISPEVPAYIQTVAASAGPLSTDMTIFDSPGSNEPRLKSWAASQAISGPGTHRQLETPRRTASNNNDNTPTFGGQAPTPPHPAYQSFATASHQVASSFAIMHHRLERDHRLLRQHISKTTDEAQDKLLACMEERIGVLGETLLERVGALEREIAALRQQIAGGSGALPAAGSGSGPRREGRGRDRRKGKEREEGEGGEVLWRRPVGGRMGDIGGRWYREEAGEE